MKSLIGLSFTALLAANALLSSCSSQRIPGQEVKTTTRYDSASRRLVITCAAASGGTCHFLVESGKERRTLTLRAGATSTLEGIDPAARICGSPSDVDPAACGWVPVLP